jgi:predicted signal transduction protein with EAL and GGDEF domain
MQDRNGDGPSWKHRRRLIYASYVLGAGMVIFGAMTYSTDTQVASQMVIGGVGLITIILTAYTGFAAYEDTRLWNRNFYSSNHYGEELTDDVDQLDNKP